MCNQRSRCVSLLRRTFSTLAFVFAASSLEQSYYSRIYMPFCYRSASGYNLQFSASDSARHVCPHAHAAVGSLPGLPVGILFWYKTRLITPMMKMGCAGRHRACCSRSLTCSAGVAFLATKGVSEHPHTWNTCNSAYVSTNGLLG